MLVDRIFGKNHVVEGERVNLRPLQVDDLTLTYLGWLNDPTINQYSQRRNTVTTIEEAQKYIEINQNSEQSCILAITLKDTDEHIGNLMLSEYDSLHGTVELSNLIGIQEYWGSGLVIDANRAILAELFARHGLRKALIGNVAQNRAATFMSKQLGFSLEGTLRRQLVLPELGECNVFRFGLFKEEFLSIRPPQYTRIG